MTLQASSPGPDGVERDAKTLSGIAEHHGRLRRIIKSTSFYLRRMPGAWSVGLTIANPHYKTPALDRCQSAVNYLVTVKAHLEGQNDLASSTVSPPARALHGVVWRDRRKCEPHGNTTETSDTQSMSQRVYRMLYAEISYLLESDLAFSYSERRFLRMLLSDLTLLHDARLLREVYLGHVWWRY